MFQKTKGRVLKDEEKQTETSTIKYGIGGFNGGRNDMAAGRRAGTGGR